MLRKKNFGNNIYIREELNGISVYETLDNLTYFYSGIKYEDVKDFETANELREFLSKNIDKISVNVILTYPYKVDWLISDSCNLNCMYCYADDKLSFDGEEKNIDIAEIIDTIDELSPIRFGISGGEPLLCEKIYDVIKYASSKIWQIILDTNGTIDISDDLYKLIINSNVLMRISVDSFNPSLTYTYRPSKSNDFYIDKLCENIEKFSDKKLMIHTVVTKGNIDDLENTGDKLIELGVNRWHLYGVSYSKKCSKFYNDIKISNDELNTKILYLKSKFKDKLNITAYFDDVEFENNIILMVDKYGKFFVDNVRTGIQYVGKDPFHPKINEVLEKIDFKRYNFANLFMATVNNK